MNNTISVIIPVYNVEKYLPECLDSVLSQTYTDLEVILIDDGSKDSSGTICDEYAKNDSRIKVIHQQNGGAAAAKNAGLRVATGKYLAFVDSDDWIERDAFEFMVNKLNEHKAEVVQCAFRNVYVDSDKDMLVIDNETVFEAQEYLRRYTVDWTCGLLWDKLYLRELFNGIFFEEGHKIDDEFFTYQGVMNANRVVYFPKVIYNYRQRGSSVTLSKENQLRMLFDKLDYLPTRRKRVIAKFPELKQDFDYHYLSLLLIISHDSNATKELIVRIKTLLKDYFKERKLCKIEASVLIKLMVLRYASVDYILNKRKSAVVNVSSKNYFD